MPEDWSILVEKVQEQAPAAPPQHAQQQQQQ
jgi:hypothetical protein